MNAQQILELYINADGNDAVRYWGKLSDLISNLVHRSVGKREIGDIEDFEEECVLSIWTKINSIKIDKTSGRIDNLEAFIRRSVHNRYCDAIRRKRPKWYNLKLELMEIFSGKANIEGFAMWEIPELNGRQCGYKQWEGLKKSGASKCRELIEDSSSFRKKLLKNRDPQEIPTYELAAAVLDYCKAPVDIDTLTGCIADLTHAYTLEPVSIDAQPDSSNDETGSPIDWLVASDTNIEKQVVDGAWFNQVIDWFWKEFLQLSVKQKKALLYGMAIDQVMALCGAVGMREVAKSLEISDMEFASLVKKLPLPDAKTAEDLDIQPRAVPSIRFKAWSRIRRRTAKSSLTLLDE